MLLFVLSVELHCFYRVEDWCAVLFGSIVVGVAGQALLVRTIQAVRRSSALRRHWSRVCESGKNGQRKQATRMALASVFA